MMNNELEINDVAQAASLRRDNSGASSVGDAVVKEPEPAATNDSTVSDLEASIIAVLRTCFDPEIPVDIYELGLIYGIDIKPPGEVTIRMTLTSPMCPVAGSLPLEVEQKVSSVPGVTKAKVDLVWDPPWCMDLMSEAAKLQLGMF
jgi:FeS assembly SUF system protein